MAALHWCHCCALNASVITTVLLTRPTARKDCTASEDRSCLFEFVSANNHLFFQRTFSPRSFFTPFILSIESVKASKKPSFFTTGTVFLLQLLLLSLLLLFMHCPGGIFFCFARVQLQQLCCAPRVATG